MTDTTTLDMAPKLARRRIGPSPLRRLLPIVPFAVALLAWVIGWAIFTPNLATMPSVVQVCQAFWERALDGRLWNDTFASVVRFFLGYGLGAISGIGVGLAVGLNRFVARMVEPLASFFTAVSGIVWIPLAIVWFGIGTGTVTFVIWNSVFFVVFATTLLGVRAGRLVLEDAVRTMGGSTWDVLTQAVVPGAMPHILSGLRSASGFGWRALIAAEIIGASSGLGAMVFQAKEYYQSDVIIMGVLVLAVLGLALDRLVLAPLERRTVERWGLVTGRKVDAR